MTGPHTNTTISHRQRTLLQIASVNRARFLRHLSTAISRAKKNFASAALKIELTGRPESFHSAGPAVATLFTPSLVEPFGRDNCPKGQNRANSIAPKLNI
jgi:hypothetical protein